VASDSDRQEADHLEKLVIWASQQLDSGRAREDVIRSLAEAGLSATAARAIVDSLPDAHQTSAPSGSSTSGATVWIVAIVGFIVLNGSLYVGQELYHAADVRQCEAIEGELANLDSEIRSIAVRLKGRSREREAIERMESELEQNHFTHGSSYDAAYRSYSDRVDRYNADVPAIKALAVRHDALVDRYNGRVEEYNRLAKTAYARWYLIPVPKGAGRSAARRNAH
jgi:hypothetical protein